MKRKSKLLMTLFLTLMILTVGCTTNYSMSSQLNLEESIREIINSKGEDYNLLADQEYLDSMDSFVKALKSGQANSQFNYALGDLDEDKIPELVIFTGKDPNILEDEGSLEIYAFDGKNYGLMDRVSMNFDLENYQIEIGNISKDKRGILLNNKVGLRSGITYGFLVEDGKLKNILNSNKVNLVSIFTKNEIRDINDDGVLEFSVYTVDPESEDLSAEGSDKMTIWYRWNGKDSANIFAIEKKDLSAKASNKEIYEELDTMLDDDFSQFIAELSDKKSQLSKYDTTELVKKYLEGLKEKLYTKSIQIENLFIRHQDGKDFNYIVDKYKLEVDDLNNMEYLNREKTLKDYPEIKKNLIKNRELAYKLSSQDEIYYYLIDYKKIFDLFGDSLTREYGDYLKVLALDSEKPFLNDGVLTISTDNLADRILIVENFKRVYPYSNLIAEIDKIYELYFKTYLYGDSRSLNFKRENKKMERSAIIEFQSKIEEHPDTNFSDIVADFLGWLEENSFFLNDDIREKLNNRLN